MPYSQRPSLITLVGGFTASVSVSCGSVCFRPTIGFSSYSTKLRRTWPNAPRRLRELLDGVEGGLEAVVECERRGDQLIRDILRRLNTSFVTPFDREDIHALAEQLDDIVDDMLEVGYLLEFGDRDVADDARAEEQADLLVQMADETCGPGRSGWRR